MITKDFDVFIAYHGSYDKNGSREICDRLYDFLKRNGIKPFYFPYSGKDIYKANIIEVIRSKTFLLVCNENIHVNESGTISVTEHYELSTEIDAFYAMTQAGNDVRVQDARVFVCGDYSEKERKVRKLIYTNYLLFCDSDNEENSFAEIADWIKSRLVLRKDSDVWQKSQTTTEVKQIFVKRSAMSQQVDLANLVAHSKNIRAMGISNSELTSRIDPEALKHAIEKGGKVELLFLDPESPFTEQREKAEGLRPNRIKNITVNNIETALDFKFRLEEPQKESYKLYKYSKLPRLNVILLDSYAILQYYGNTEAGMRNPCFLIEKQEVSPLYDFCLENYRYIKSNAEEITEE